MKLTPHDLWLPFLWVANGLLTVLYLLAGRLLALLLLPPSAGWQLLRLLNSVSGQWCHQVWR